MTSPAYNRARACFALAASTTFEGERANAISLGTAIAEEAGLSLDLFDIPGRVKKGRPTAEAWRAAATRASDDLFKAAPPTYYTAETLNEALRAYRDSLRGTWARSPDVGDAFAYGATATAMSERADRMEREQRAAFPTPESAANYLWGIGFPTYPDVDDADERIWRVQQGSALVDYSSEDLVGLAMDHKRMRGESGFDRHGKAQVL